MSATFTLTGSSAGAVKAVDDYAKALKEAEKAADDTAKGSKRLNDQAQRIRESINPQEKYNNQIKKLAELTVRAGLDTDVARQKAAQYGMQLERAGKSGEQAFGASAITNIKGYLAGLVSVGGAISLIRGEYENIIKIAEQINRAQRTAAQGELALRKNAFALPQAEQDALLAAAPRISANSNLKQGPIYQALAGTLSATGDAKLSEQLVDVAAQFTRSETEVEPFAAGLGDIIATSDIRDPKDALGFLALTQAGSRLTDPARVADAVGKVTAAYTSPIAGGTAAEGGAFFAALTKGGADPRGESTRTAAIQVIQKTEEFFKKQSGFKPEDIDQVGERINLLLADKGLAEKFVRTTRFESAAQGAVEKLFLEDGSTRAAYEDTLGSLSDPAKRVEAANKALAYVTGGKLQAAAQSEAIVESAVDAFDLGQEFVFSDENREKLLGMINRGSRTPLFKDRLDMFTRTGPTLDRNEAIAEARGRISELEFRQVATPLTDTQEKSLEQLRAVADKLEAINRNTQAKVATRSE